MPISLIVCCKNEAQNLPRLLASIDQQTYTDFEVIFANDHSTDETAKILDEYAKNHTFASVFVPQKNGKKNALREAVLQAKNDIIVCTDADCTLQPTHVAQIADYFAKKNPDLLLGGVRIATHNFFSRLQALEFASLIASTAGACALKMPIMCNGANLAFKKMVFEQLSNKLKDNELSGDDQFLLFAAKRTNMRIDFLKSSKAIVTTQPQKTLCDFFNQRARWTSKTKSYTDLQTLATAGIVFCATIAIFALFIGIFLQKTWLVPLAVTFGAKFCVDTLFLSLFLPFLQQTRLVFYTPILSLLYPFYVIFSVLFGFFGKWSWKKQP